MWRSNTAGQRVNTTSCRRRRPIWFAEVSVAARSFGLQVQVLNASASREINAAFATFVLERPDALFIGGDPFFNDRRVQLANL
jgi:hypothetical protein